MVRVEVGGGGERSASASPKVRARKSGSRLLTLSRLG